MTELCSQFYETRLLEAKRRFVGPPWVRTLAIDPETLRPLPFGERGLLAHWDLANAWTVVAVLTEDVGVVHEDGFELEGRRVGSDLRGCSLVTEEILDGR
jgi:Acyl-protein synthetase, LuxE